MESAEVPSYCPPGISFLDIWIDHGFSKCFIETVSNGSVCAFLLIFGSLQLYIYKKYATEISENTLRRSCLYKLQLFLHIFVPLIAIVRFILQATILDDKTVYGYMILTLVLNIFMYPYALLILSKERRFMLPSVPSRGHGLILLQFWCFVFVFENLSFVNLGQKRWWFHLHTLSDKLEMTLFVLRYTSCLCIFILGLKAPGILLNSDYYNLNDSSSHITMIPPETANQGSTWRNAWKKIRLLAPFVWPKKDRFLQVRVIVCFSLLIIGRALNLLVPIYSRALVDSMNVKDAIFRWDLVLIFVGLKFFQGGGTGIQGLLNNLRAFLWIRVQQYTTREIEIEMFRHLHSLSLRWHLNRKSGEVLRVMDRGTDSVNNLLSNILFNILPIFVDITIAVVFFFTTFNAWFGIIVFITMFLYILSTIGVTEWRTKFHRQMNLADNATKARAVDSLLNFETVKYYGAEAYEVNEYREAIHEYQKMEWLAIISLNILNCLQNVVVTGGLLAGSLYCVYLVVDTHTLTVGDYVLFSTYILQLYMPLNWFGTYYRVTQRNFIDMENMLDLFKEPQEVIDPPNAPKLIVKRGQIDFNNVTFGYTPERVILKNISFTVPAGKTVALVGPTGSGKSTVVRLLFRFYDVDEGAILIDGQNLKTVQQESVRKAIGVVPQDITLFNNTIKYNIRYGNINSPDADVIEAARNADFHEKIVTFPDGYETVVGERGLRLSGGEKQRVGIARTILKAPQIVLLDEATSALDTHTERNIQSALKKICTNRTTVVVAHRLSTIIHADEILVLKDGEIVERGKHDDLISIPGGVYAKMWRVQLQKQASVDIPNEADEEEQPSKAPEEDVPPPNPHHHHHHS
ncbi:ATP-binding cassette sub-family B member 6 [Chrysoperla carnea]|uniref:ATP-binding cassette sub-family B member 6 n=1 Tax=Chrysoperla carnea TaxID=189513 RepID=UPI001D0866DC|nr:ATP-binding cassette sub-family B member 6 [Chrysoperla carnea]